MRLSGKEILDFLNKRYSFIQLVFEASQPSFMLEAEVMHQLLNEYNIPPKELEELKFAMQIPTGEYLINSIYTDFLQFVFKKFVLDLPSTMANRCENIFNLFSELQTATDDKKRLLFIQELMKEINHFVMDIKGETNKLIQDTEALKVNAENTDDLTRRIEKADYWIREYINPFNTILDKNHPNSITSIISQISQHAGEKSLWEEDFEFKHHYSKLYGCTLFAQNEINIQNGKITRELTPLLERIRSDSLILKGFYHFLEDDGSNSNHDVLIPNLIKKQEQLAIAETDVFKSEAMFYVDQFQNQHSETFTDTEPESSEVFAGSEYYKEKLMSVLPVSDFYSWCYEALQEEKQKLSLENFFVVSNLILAEDIGVDYKSKGKITVELSDAILITPKVIVYAIPQGT